MTPIRGWRTAALAIAAFAASPASAQLGADAEKTYDDFQRLGPHRALALSAEGKAYLWAGSSGADPNGAIAVCSSPAKSAAPPNARSTPSTISC